MQLTKTKVVKYRTAIFKKWLANMMLASISIIFTLFLIEIGLRFVYPAHERDWTTTHQPDEQLGWAYIPKSSQWYSSPGEFRTYFEINALGQRDIERTYDKSVETYRILMLGDSFVASLQTPLEESFVKVTEDNLTRSKFLQSRPIEILNAGTGGYGTDQELRWFRQKGTQYEADAIILTMFLGNDIADNDFELWYLAGSQAPSKPFFALKNKQLVDIGQAGRQTTLSGDEGINILRLRRQLQRYSYTYALISSALTKLEGQPAFNFVLKWLGRSDGADTYNHSYDLFAETLPAEWTRAWNLTEVIVLTLKKEVEAQGSDFGIVLIPHPVQVHKDWWAARRTLYPAMDQRSWNLSAPNTRMSQFLNTQKIPHLDLLPPLLNYVEETGSHIYYRSDGHFTVEGNQVVGELIATWIQQTFK